MIGEYDWEAKSGTEKHVNWLIAIANPNVIAVFLLLATTLLIINLIETKVKYFQKRSSLNSKKRVQKIFKRTNDPVSKNSAKRHQRQNPFCACFILTKRKLYFSEEQKRETERSWQLYLHQSSKKEKPNITVIITVVTFWQRQYHWGRVSLHLLTYSSIETSHLIHKRRTSQEVVRPSHPQGLIYLRIIFYLLPARGLVTWNHWRKNDNNVCGLWQSDFGPIPCQGYGPLVSLGMCQMFWLPSHPDWKVFYQRQ